VLEHLQGQPLTVPVTLRKSMGLHPETFRRLILDMNEFALISIRAMPGARWKRERTGRRLSIPIGIELSPMGEDLLEITRDVRETIRRHAPRLPESSVKNWLLG